MKDALQATWTEVEYCGFRMKTWHFGPEADVALDLVDDEELSDLEELDGADALAQYLRAHGQAVYTAKLASIFDVPIHVVRIAAAELVKDGRAVASPDGLVAA